MKLKQFKNMVNDTQDEFKKSLKNHYDKCVKLKIIIFQDFLK